jgi:hypothetical protein
VVPVVADGAEMFCVFSPLVVVIVVSLVRPDCRKFTVEQKALSYSIGVGFVFVMYWFIYENVT